MAWLFLLLLFLLNLTFNGFSEPLQKKQIPLPLPLPPAVVVGTVFCDTCFQQDLSKTAHFISGATVAVECRDGSSEAGFRKQVKTNKKGKFKVVLPFSVAKHTKKIEGCSVKLIRSSEPFCSVASSATSSSLHLKSRKKGMRIFSAGFFTFKPLEQPSLCSQKPTIFKAKQVASMKTFLPPLDTPVLPSLVPTPELPNHPKLPDLPPMPPLTPLPLLPPLPGLPPPSKKLEQKQTNPQFFFPPVFPPVFPPNPLQPPPLIPNPFQPPPLIPNPFQPPPLIPNPFQPPAPIIPNPFHPPPAPFFPLPPIPFLTPPPPPPSLIPPFFPPWPRIPGFPPGPPREETSPSTSKQSP